jgi:hypothetical protein
LVSDGQYLNKVPGAKQWYTPPSKPLPTTVRLQQVLNLVLHMVGISQQNKLPSNCDKRACERLGARWISNNSHDTSKKFAGESAWNLKRNTKTKSQKKIWMKILCRIVMISTRNVQNHLREESYNHCRAIMLNNM